MWNYQSMWACRYIIIIIIIIIIILMADLQCFEIICHEVCSAYTCFL